MDNERQGGPGAALHWAAFALALLCGLAVQAPHLLLHRAFVNLDFTVHYNYAREVAASIDAGDFWPHYAFRAQQGLGEPGLLFYSPLYYMASWLLSRATGNVWAAMQLVEVLAAGGLGYFAWRLAAAYSAPHRALAAVPLAVFAPMVCLLQLGFNGYPWACALAPLAALLWAVLRPQARGRLVNLAAAAALAVTVLTHTVTGLMGVIALGAMSLAALFCFRLAALRHPEFWSPVLSLAAGLALSAAYLLPAFASQGLVDSGVWRENYTPFNAFSLSAVTAWKFGIRWFAFQWPVSLAAFALSGLSLWALRGRTSGEAETHFAWAATAICAVVFVLATELSYPLWTIDTPLRNIQFPHRLISVLVPLAAALAAIGWQRAQNRLLRGGIALAALGTLAMGGLTVVKAAVRDGAPVDVSERHFAPYNGLDEYRTRAATQRGTRGNAFDFAYECAARGMACSAGVRSGRGMVWRIAAPAAGALRLPVYCFPAWRVDVDGKPAAARCDARQALVETDVPAGRSTVSLQWQAMPLERAGYAISLLALLALGCAALAGRKRAAA